MDFRLTDDQDRLREAARVFAAAEMPAIARDLEDNDEPLGREHVKRYAGMGFLGINVAEDLGGLGLGNIEALLVLEEFAKVSPAVAFPIFESSVGPVRAVEHFAEGDLARRIVPRVCAGDMIVAVAMSEPDAGSALTDLKTRAELKGGAITLNGQKRWCSGGGHADGYVVYARMSDDPGARGIGAVFVEKDRDGLSFGAPERLMGFRGIPSADIFFDDVRVPAENLIGGEEGRGLQQILAGLELGRINVAARGVGLARVCLDESLAYAQNRKTFGKPICEHQAIQIKLADMATRVEAARLLTEQAARAYDTGERCDLEAGMAKLFATEAALENSLEAMRIHGAYGYSKEFNIERYYRDAPLLAIGEGTNELQRIIIARQLVERNPV